MNIKGKTFILTGARRIGQTVAEELAKKGANLAITYRSSKEESEATCTACIATGVRAVPFQAELSKEEDIKKLIVDVKAEFGSIDGLIHMAASYDKTPFESLTEDSFDKAMTAISRSAFLMGKIVGGILKESGGKIIFFSDWASNCAPYKDYLPYHMAKGSVETLTRALAVELSPNVTVNCIAPGPILRPPDLSDEDNSEVEAKTLLKPWPGAEEIAKAVIFFLENDFTTGVILPVDGGRSIV